MEVTQFTYFQQAGGFNCKPVTGEITYGIERLAMYIQSVESIYDLVWSRGEHGEIRYGDLYLQNEQEQSAYNYEHADIESLFQQFSTAEQEAARLAELELAIPAYEQVLKASHAFNLLDARHAISVTERQGYILRIREQAKNAATAYYQSREKMAFPLLKASRKEGNH